MILTTALPKVPGRQRNFMVIRPPRELLSLLRQKPPTQRRVSAAKPVQVSKWDEWLWGKFMNIAKFCQALFRRWTWCRDPTTGRRGGFLRDRRK
jgi:hypothetical protein